MGGAGTRKEERHAYAALICDDADESAYLGLSVQRAGLPCVTSKSFQMISLHFFQNISYIRTLIINNFFEND